MIHIQIIGFQIFLKNLSIEYYQLNSRLNEADIILNQGDFTDTTAVEKLITDIDDTYESCRNRNYLNANQNMQMQIRISTVKEGFKKRYGMQKKIQMISPTRP